MKWPNASVGMWIVFVVGVVVCLVLAKASSSLATYSWNQVVDYKSPYVSVPAPAELVSANPAPGSAVAHRVVLIIVDGLRDDVSRSEMPTVQTLRAHGADFTLTVPQPSLSYPNWTTILTGASPQISGVTTNWFTGRELAPTLIDVARSAGDKVAVAGPTDFTKLFGIRHARGVSLRSPSESDYVSGMLIDDTIRLSKETSPTLIVVHLPDLDTAGHNFGGASTEYRQVAAQIDTDIGRLVLGMQGTSTTFVITADHGHTDSGGHGGWEPSVLHVPAVFSGDGIRAAKGTGDLQQIAPTVAVLLGLRDPAFAEGQAIRSVVATTNQTVFASDQAHHLAFDSAYVAMTNGHGVSPQDLAGDGTPDGAVAAARRARLTAERWSRLPLAVAIWIAVIAAVAAVGMVSWRALVSALAGSAAYYVVYSGLFFVVHGYHWSLSAFNTETYVKTFMNWRLAEAGAAALIGVAVAAFVYPLLRRNPKGPRTLEYLSGYLALGPATLLVLLGTLWTQAAWYLWQWGADVVWTLPDLRLAFKYDLDLVQVSAIGVCVLFAPLVTYLIGRYHPKVM
jgi:Type I phosphodiesterase / nucleotide pyrophosphatase